MNKRMIWVLSAALLSGVSVSAIASNHGMGKPHDHRSHGHRDSGKATEAELSKLELALKLDSAQRPAWTAFSQDIQNLLQARDQQRQGMREAMIKARESKTIGATERMEAMGQMMQVQQAQLEKMKAATQTFMAQLSPSQQKVFNAEASSFLGGGQGKSSHRRGDKKPSKSCQG